MKAFFKSGHAFIWLTGGALALSLLMVAGLLLLIMVNGLGFFWPADLLRLSLADGREVLGRVARREAIPQPDAPPGTPVRHRVQIKQANRDLYGADFIWIDEADIGRRDTPADAVVIERLEWGDLQGVIREVRDAGLVVATGPAAGWEALQRMLPAARALRRDIQTIERDAMDDINRAQDRIRLALRRLELRGVDGGPEGDRLERERRGLDERFAALAEEVAALRTRQTASVVVEAPGAGEKDLPLDQVVRAYRPNRMGVFAKSAAYAAKIREFVSDDPRESNTEGGVFPAIFGTVMLVMIMSVLVMPLGVLGALYLREYARQGPLVSAVRIAVNNLAGVPSIVFGVFGVGFFIYFVGGGIDRLFFAESLPTPTFGTGGILWASLTLALLTVPVVIVATEEGLAAIPRGMREASLALGATKFETTWRVVLPAVMPAILTGLILAMARAAGEVAPLMITGVVKLAPALPVDARWPFFHFDRKFMHLGFHIFDVGFQSPNVDAARPMVYTTTMLLILIVLALNLGAIALRNHLRKRLFVSAL